VEGSSNKQLDCWLLAAIIVVAAVLHWHIGQESLWLDEGASVGIVRLPWSAFLKLMYEHEANMVLYYLLLRGWMVFGASEAWLRALSAVFSVATIPVVYLIGREVRSRATGFVAALLFAVSPFAIAYAEEARSYSLVCLLVSAATWFLLRRQWSCWAWMIGLAVYAHFFALLVLAAHVLYLVITRYPVRDLRTGLSKLVLALMPALAFVLLRNAGQLTWIPPLSVSEMKDVFGEWAGGGDLALIILFLAVLGAVITWRPPVATNPTLVIWLWLLVPILVIVAVSIVRPLLVSRFLILSLPALLIAAGIALTEVPKPISLMLLVVIAFFSVRAELLAWQTPSKDDLRGASAYVLQRSSAEDSIIFHIPMARHAFEYYAWREHASNAPGLMSPSHGARATERDFQADGDAELVAKIHKQRPVLWLMLTRNETKGSPDEYTRFVMSKVKEVYAQCEDRQFRGVLVRRCTR